MRPVYRLFLCVQRRRKKNARRTISLGKEGVKYYRKDDLKAYLERNCYPPGIVEKLMQDMENVECMRTFSGEKSYLEIRESYPTDTPTDTCADTVSGICTECNGAYPPGVPECEEKIEDGGFFFVRRVYVWDDAGDGAVVYIGGKNPSEGKGGAQGGIRV